MTPETRSLLRAAAMGDLELVKSLIAQGTEVNCVSAAGQTPLMLASGFGHEAIVKVLLESGAFIGATDELGLSAADWSANFPRIRQLIVPLRAPDEVDRSNNHQATIARLTAQRIQAANKQQAEQSEPRVTLGGLAGAILRERVAKSANPLDEQHEEATDVLPPPAPPPTAVVDTPGLIDSIEVEPVIDSQIDLDQPGAPSPDSAEPLVDYSVGFEESSPEALVTSQVEEEKEVAATHLESEPIVDQPIETEELIGSTPREEEPIIDHPIEMEEPIAWTSRQSEPIDYPFEQQQPDSSRTAGTQPIIDYPFEYDEPIPSTTRTTYDQLKTETPVESRLTKNQRIIDYPEEYEHGFQESRVSDDDTLSRAEVRTSDDTSPSTPSAKQRREAFQSLGLTEAPPPARISKVQVNVSPKARQGSTRTLIWILVILFLGGGAYAGYRLSSYLLNSTNNPETTITPKAEPQPQPTLGPVKAAPVVGGELAGSELFVPDAEYPTGAAPQSGVVVVRVRVNLKGIVLTAEATEGQDNFRAAAEQAGKQAAFSPDKLRGKGQVIGGTITYTFTPPTAIAPASSSSTSTATAPTETNGPHVGGPLAGAEVNVPTPVYPAAARNKNIAGTVTIVVRVNRAGRVVSWRTLEGDNRLRGAALTAAKRATFDPSKLPGSGDVVGTITYTFSDQ